MQVDSHFFVVGPAIGSIATKVTFTILSPAPSNERTGCTVDKYFLVVELSGDVVTFSLSVIQARLASSNKAA